jgi:transcriptional regulator with XRE-family HTH domain
METLGQQIRAERRRRGLTGAQLAEMAGCSQPQVSNIERDERGAISPSALALIEALGLRVVLVPLDAEQAAK